MVNKESRIPFYLALLSLALLLSGCAVKAKNMSPVPAAGGGSLEEHVSQFHMDMLKEESFHEVEPQIQALKPGDKIGATGLTWQFYKIEKWSKQKNVAVLNGWVGGLSGKHFGAIFQVGKLTGISKDFIYGEHVFGFLWGNTNLIPRYLISTKAPRINQSEYDKLSEQQKKVTGTFSVK